MIFSLFTKPPDPEFLKAQAKRMRHQPTAAEKKFRFAFKEGFPETTLRNQYVIPPYIVDFYLPDHKLIIELDGGQHNDNPADKKRDAALKRQGYQILRFWNNDIFTNMEGCLWTIQSKL